MKKLLFLALVICFAGAASAALVHEWQFEGNLNDTSGSGNHGTGVGNVQYAQGLPNCGDQALYCDGQTYVVNNNPSNLPWAMPSPLQIRGPEFSMSVYVKADPDGPWGDWDGIAGWGQYGSNADRTFTTRYSANPWFHGYQHNVSVSFDLADGKWHHLAFTFDQVYGDFYGDEKMYIDGELVHANNHVHFGDVPVSPVWAGYWVSRPSGQSYWNGLIDNYTIWDNALSQSEVEAMAGCIPEPATIALLGLGGLALLRRKR